MRVEVACPECEETLMVTVALPPPRRRALRRREPDEQDFPELQEAVGCPHAAAMLEDDRLFAQVLEAVDLTLDRP